MPSPATEPSAILAPPTAGAPARYRVLTPEGVPLLFEVAAVGDRMAAFLVDLLFIVGGGMAVFVTLALLGISSGEIELAAALGLLAAFVLRHVYFTWLELRWSGLTYGKRRLGLRVLARDGGPLTAEMVIARNLMRDLEFFLPVTVLLAPEALIPQGGGWGVVAGLVWIFVFALMPFFGKARLRCGDLIAGTVVAREPRATLLADLAEKKDLRKTPRPATKKTGDGRPAPAPETPCVFTPQQLEHYGIRELQVLEDLFRRYEEDRAPASVLDEVGARIRKKIGWAAEGEKVESLRFLRDFYKAQRAHLEKKLLFGERKERKSNPGR